MSNPDPVQLVNRAVIASNKLHNISMEVLKMQNSLYDHMGEIPLDWQITAFGISFLNTTAKD